MMNREQRRAYWRKIVKNPAVSECPECHYKTLFYTTSVNGATVVKCGICDAIIREGEEVQSIVPPGITLPLTLEAFDRALLYEAGRRAEEALKHDERNENSTATSEDNAAPVEGTVQQQSDTKNQPENPEVTE